MQFDQTSLTALQQLCQNLRLLNEALVAKGQSADVLTQLNAGVKDLLGQLENGSDKRPIAHFNNHLAPTEPNLALPYSPMCGPFNPVAPPLDLQFDQDKQILNGFVTCNRVYEGPYGMVHGGIISAFYDQILAMLTTCSNRPSFTAYLHVDFLKPTPLHTELHFSAQFDKIDGRKAFITGQCIANGEVVTQANGLFIHAQ